MVGWLCTLAWVVGVLVGVVLGCGGLWLVSLIGVAHVMGFRCFLACESGFGCGSVRVEVTLKIGCVWDSMLLVFMWWVA